MILFFPSVLLMMACFVIGEQLKRWQWTAGGMVLFTANLAAIHFALK
jgi:hypothetical protein